MDTLQFDIKIVDALDKLTLYYIKEDFDVLSDAMDAEVSDPAEGETVAGAIRALQVEDHVVVVMVQFVFDTKENPVGPLKRVDFFRMDEDGPHEITSLDQAGFAEVLMS